MPGFDPGISPIHVIANPQGEAIQSGHGSSLDCVGASRLATTRALQKSELTPMTVKLYRAIIRA
jgi:hypothetical protein